MRVLVTGSSGWLGRHLAPALRRAGHDPIGLDLAAGEHTEVVGSVTDRGLIDAVFEEQRVEAVVHAGGLHKPDLARCSAQAFIDVNVSGTLNVLQAATRVGASRLVFTSTTSLMVSRAIREERFGEAVWLDEGAGPLEPRNVYGVTKLAAEGLCRRAHLERGLSVVVLRTARFFPEEDDTIRAIAGRNLKANELLHRRATVCDIARAHAAALDAPGVGFGLYVVSAPTPFERSDAAALKRDAASVIRERFADAEALYAAAGWELPGSIGRVYDGTHITRELGFRYETGFAEVLAALRAGREPPIDHDPSYVSPPWQDRRRERSG